MTERGLPATEVSIRYDETRCVTRYTVSSRVGNVLLPICSRRLTDRQRKAWADKQVNARERIYGELTKAALKVIATDSYLRRVNSLLEGMVMGGQ